MSLISEKHKEFMVEPMGEKHVMELPGIGQKLGKILEKKGFEKAYTVLGKFLLLKRNEVRFGDWLNRTCDANAEQQDDCFSCLEEWCKVFL